MLTRKIQCHERMSTSTPPRNGATIGAASAGQVRIAMAVTSWSRPARRSTTSLPTGTISAPPRPCRIRHSVNSTRPEEAAQRADAIVKSAMAPTKTVREPTRSVIHPLTGMNTASVTRYAVIATPTAAESTPRSRPIAGAAVARIVPSRSSMK
jgi:hypothetical protein